MTTILERRFPLRIFGLVVALPVTLATCLAPWSGVKAEGTPLPEIAASPQELRMGAWNIKKLGHKNNKNYRAVAEVIEKNFDVIAIVEIMQIGGTHPGYDKLLKNLGPLWSGLITKTPRPNIRSGRNSGNAEFYAIMFRRDRIAVCDGWDGGLVYYQDDDGSSEAVGSGVFDREPAFVCLQSRRRGVKAGFDFMLAAYHARWGKGVNDAKRRSEVRRLTDVFKAMSAARPGEMDLIIAGDFNLTPEDMLKARKSCPEMSHNGHVLDCLEPANEHKGTRPGSTLNESGERVNIYDYILVHDTRDTSEMTGSPEIIDVCEVVGDCMTFFKSVSDHLPVVALFKTDGMDDD